MAHSNCETSKGKSVLTDETYEFSKTLSCNPSQKEGETKETQGWPQCGISSEMINAFDMKQDFLTFSKQFLPAMPECYEKGSHVKVANNLPKRYPVSRNVWRGLHRMKRSLKSCLWICQCLGRKVLIFFCTQFSKVFLPPSPPDKK